MTISQRGATQTGAATANFTVTKPTGTADGDQLLCWVAMDAGSANSITGPTGWTKSRDDNDGAGFSIGLQVWTKIASGEPASWTWTNAGAAAVGFVLVALTGGDTANVLDGAGGGTVVSGVAGTSTDAPSTTPTVATDWDLRAYTIDNGSVNIATDTITLPTGYTALATNVVGGSSFTVTSVGYKVLTSTAATGIQTATNTSAADRVGMSLLAKDSAGAATPYVIPPDPYYVAKRV